jgi:hypothetical protein
MRVPTPMSIGRGVSSRSPSQGGTTVSRLSTSATKSKMCSIVSARRTAIVSRNVPSRWRPIWTGVRDLIKGVPIFCARFRARQVHIPCADEQQRKSRLPARIERHFGVLRMLTWDTDGQQCSSMRANDL